MSQPEVHCFYAQLHKRKYTQTQTAQTSTKQKKLWLLLDEEVA